MPLLRRRIHFYWGGIKETLCTGSNKPENITILQNRLTFLLRTTARSYFSFVINSQTNPPKELQKRTDRFYIVLNNSTYPFIQLWVYQV